MKKVLLAGTALLGVAFIATPAAAELNLDLGGYFRGYGVYADNDEPGGPGADSLREFEFRRDTEIHFTGETTLDNGLTIGFHNEMNLEANDLTDESYAYFSGGWGRVNFGTEDGAAYLLQVAAPSADSNVDGLRQYISAEANALNNAAVFGAFTTPVAGVTIGALDYDHADFRQTDRITYLTPKFNGFQAGASYAPIAGQMTGIAGMTVDNDGVGVEDLWEVAARWDGEFSGFGLSIGAGYSTADLETTPAAPAIGVVADGLDTWNIGASIGWNSFTLGAAYLNSESAQFTGVGTASVDVDVDTWVIGAAWDNGPYHVGVTYLEREIDRSSAIAAFDGNYEQDRWTIGAGYTYGPGMTFRGALAMTDNDATFGVGGGTAVDNDTTQVTIGTDIQF